MPPWSHSSLHLGFRSRSRSASCRSRGFVSPPAARCFVGGIPPFSPRLHLAAKAANRVNPASLNSTLKPSRRSSPRQRCVCLRSISGGASHRLGQCVAFAVGRDDPIAPHGLDHYLIVDLPCRPLGRFCVGVTSQAVRQKQAVWRWPKLVLMPTGKQAASNRASD